MATGPLCLRLSTTRCGSDRLLVRICRGLRPVQAIERLGLGLGGMVAASILEPGNAASFEMLYRIDALTFLVYFALIAGMKFDFSLAPEHHVKESGGYRDVFRDRKFLLLTIGSLGTLTFGYASLSTGLPIIVTQHLGLSPKWLGIIFGANTKIFLQD